MSNRGHAARTAMARSHLLYNKDTCQKSKRFAGRCLYIYNKLFQLFIFSQKLFQACLWHLPDKY